MQEVLEELRQGMDKSIDSFNSELAKVRTGRASTALLDGIKVDYYGTPTPLNQLATISAPESRLITIQPWDINSIGEIEKAIMKSDLGLTPQNDGKIIRITIPTLTEERRKELVKLVKNMAEDYRVALRNQRRDSNDFLKELKKEKEISEDDFFRLQDRVQEVTDEYVKKVDELVKQKEQEIMEI